MRRLTSAARQLPVFFIKNEHRWVDITKNSDYIRVKCECCGLIAMQERGSLLFFVVEGDSYEASLSCDQRVIKNIIE